MAARSGNEFTSSGEHRRPRGQSVYPSLLAICMGLALAGSVLPCACNKPPPAREWPPGTVVAIDDVPVTSAEIAQDMLGVVLVDPQWTDAQMKRLAFNEIALPRALKRSLAAKGAREAAQRALEEQFARISSGSQIGPQPTAGIYGHEVSGAWNALGLVAWGSAMNLNVGQWSEVLEEPGAFLRVRLLERKEGAAPAAAWLRMDRIEASYVPENETGPNQDAEMRRHHLTIVDPAWDAIIPERTKYLMGVHDQ